LLIPFVKNTRRLFLKGRMQDMTPDTDSTYAQTTKQITVTVDPVFLEEESDPGSGLFFWAYHVEIKNNGDDTVQLISRHWRITNAMGALQEVRGDGVVGEQPVLKPGEAFEYTSGTPLSTSSGIMGGNYHMISSGGRTFDINIPTFSLDSPYEGHVVH
jgi:ApaG protein